MLLSLKHVITYFARNFKISISAISSVVESLCVAITGGYNQSFSARHIEISSSAKVATLYYAPFSKL